MPNPLNLIRSILQRQRRTEATDGEEITVPKKPLNLFYRKGTAKPYTIQIQDDEELDQFLSQEYDPRSVSAIIINSNRTINCLPIMIGRFDEIVSLSLRDNYITDLPWSIVYLKNLTQLDLSYNLLTRLPKTIGHLDNLINLDISANHLTALPTELIQLNKLETINVSNNKNLTSPPQKVCESGVIAIRDALMTRSVRSNMWKNCTPWISGENMPVSYGQFKTLIAMCVDVIVKYKVEFICNPAVPPVIKQGLEEKVMEHKRQLHPMKCSACKQFFSNEDFFECHCCTRK